MIYETDTDRIYIFNGADWEYRGGGTAPAGLWSVPTFTNGWTNFGTGFQAARYCKINGIVYIEGLIKTGTMGSPAFTLAAGHRPAASLLIGVGDGANSIGRLDITAAGGVTPSTGNPAYFQITCSFVASQ